MAFLPIYLGSLFFRMDECIQNNVKSTGCYHVITHADTVFLQVFLWEKSKTLSTKPNQYEAVEMIAVEKNRRVVESPDRPYQLRA